MAIQRHLICEVAFCYSCTVLSDAYPADIRLAIPRQSAILFRHFRVLFFNKTKN